MQKLYSLLGTCLFNSTPAGCSSDDPQLANQSEAQTPRSPRKSNKLSAGAVAAIVVSLVAACVAVGVAAVLLQLRKQRGRTKGPKSKSISARVFNFLSCSHFASKHPEAQTGSQKIKARSGNVTASSGENLHSKADSAEDMEAHAPRHVFQVSAGLRSESSNPTPVTTTTYQGTGSTQTSQMLPLPPPKPVEGMTSDAWGSTPPSMQPQTLHQQEEKQKIIVALRNMAESSPPCLFAKRYLLTLEFAAGGQSVVTFARSEQGADQYAIKCAAAQFL
jgi:hypothetical protein